MIAFLTRGGRGDGPLAALRNDLRHAARGLLARPGFTAAVVATIALGVGANAAVFSVVNAALLRPLPFAEPERLVHLWHRPADTPGAGRMEASYPDFLDLRSRSRTLAAVAGYHTARTTLADGDQAVVLPTAKVTADFFDVLGVTPLAGRRFAAGEDAVGAPRVALLGHALWRRAFGGDRGVVGRTVQVDGAPASVVGVLPPDFHFAAAAGAELWVPIDRPATMRERRGTHWLKPVARLRDGATLESTRRELDGIARDLGREHPDESGGLAVDVVPLHDELVGPVRPVLLTLYAAVAFVLLVACGNVANLLLMRGAARARELSIRAALGAGRGRLVRQFLAESLLLAVVGGVAGVAVAALGVRGLVTAVPAEQARLLPYLQQLRLDGTVLAYAAALSLVAGALFGALPAVRASRADPQPVLRQGGGSPAAGLRALRDGLVVAELALTVVLVSGAALFAHSLARVLDRPTGFRAERLLTMTVPLPRWQYASEDAQRAFYRALEQRVAAIPGVRGVGLTSKLPLDYGNSTSYAVAGDPPQAPGRAPSASFRVVNPAYFATLGVPLRRGRTFTEGEDASAGRVVVVNEALARAAFGARDPLGRALQLGDQPATVVGVVGDVAVGKLEDEVPPTMYFSYLQSMDVGMRLAVRTAGDPYALVAPVRAAVRAVDPAVGTYQVYAMDDVVAQSPSVFLRRYPLVLVGTFAGVALVLALVGTYGVISYAVAQRGRELGIRIALGAGSASIRWAVLRHAGTLAAAGIAVGLAAATGAARLAAGLFYGVEGAAQPAIFGAVAALLAAMALLAALLPAQRATRADPLAALKGE